MHPGWAGTPGVAAQPAPPSGLFWHDRRPRDPNLVPWTRHSEADSQAMLDWRLDAVKL
jgi:dehydrogenase/reductase SDR family protein 12